jgi:hypothetical protein
MLRISHKVVNITQYIESMRNITHISSVQVKETTVCTFSFVFPFAFGLDLTFGFAIAVLDACAAAELACSL